MVTTMLRRFLKRLSCSTATPPEPTGPPEVLLYARVEPSPLADSPICETERPDVPVTAQRSIGSPQHGGSDQGGGKLERLDSGRVNHRARLLSMDLEHTRLCSLRRCEQ